ncbi:MAG: hypothetical protein Q7S86_01520 [bacterium]|nr:hypothetical protein [bacterium]
MKNFIHFVKYNNTFVIILGLLFLSTGAFASEKVRDAVIGQRIEEKSGVDNSAILATDLDSFKQNIAIKDVTESEENYFVTYDFNTMDIADNSWKPINKAGSFKVSKASLGGADLGLYVQKQLAEVMDSQTVYLKKVQERELSLGRTQITETVTYTGLKGLVFDSETNKLEGYEPVVKTVEREDVPYIAPVVVSNPAPVADAQTPTPPLVLATPTSVIIFSSPENSSLASSTATTTTTTAPNTLTSSTTTSTSTTTTNLEIGSPSDTTSTTNLETGSPSDTEAPVITIQGSTTISFIITITTTVYIDPGAVVSDNKDTNLGVYASTFKDGIKLSDTADITDTSTTTTYEIHYNTTDNAGNIAEEKVRTVTFTAPAPIIITDVASSTPETATTTTP